MTENPQSQRERDELQTTHDEVEALAITAYLEALAALDDVKASEEEQPTPDQSTIEVYEKAVRVRERLLQKHFPEVDLEKLRKANNR